MIDYIKDMLVPGKITTFPYKMTGPIAIASRNGHYLRCPAWAQTKRLSNMMKTLFMLSQTLPER